MEALQVAKSERVRPAESACLPRPCMQEPFTLVIFGASGVLTSSKLLPALFRLWHDEYFARPFAIVGVGRRDKNDERFRKELGDAVRAHGRLWPGAEEAWNRFVETLFYHRADFTAAEGYDTLSERLRAIEDQLSLGRNRLYYLATDPDYFPLIVEHLASAKLLTANAHGPSARVVVEKPFGKDLASARTLDQQLLRFLCEEQIFRIDHYLGKETVQNLLSFRFGNAIFEPIFNNRYVDHVQITMAEATGMEARRGAYYDGAGALRDVVQNHLLQLLAFVAMEPPGSLGAKEIRDEKVKLLRSLVPGNVHDLNHWVVRGQYGAGMVDSQGVRPYREEEAVAADSTTETYVALRLGVDNWRWAGVPFVLRTGKRLSQRVTEIAVLFKQPPVRLFTTMPRNGDLCDRLCSCGSTCTCAIAGMEPGALVFRIQPDEGVSLSFSAKRPGMQLALQPVRMDFRYRESTDDGLPEAYERLLMDVLRRDQTLFMRSDEVMAAWEFITPILDAWKQQPPPRFPNYAAGSWGPAEAERLMSGCHQVWRQP